jgi:hypothetical protein
MFQGLSYHDTPEGPPPEMRYVDVSAKPGEKHTYSILTVNSAGVPSERIRSGDNSLNGNFEVNLHAMLATLGADAE